MINIFKLTKKPMEPFILPRVYLLTNFRNRKKILMDKKDYYY